MMNDAKNTTISNLCDKGLLTADTPPNVDSALAALNGALAAMKNLRVSPHDSPDPDPLDFMTRDEKRQCLESK